MKTNTAERPLTVLYVEDEDSDVCFMRRAFEQVAPGVRLEAVADGQEAMDYLTGSKQYGDRTKHPLPALMLLDLKLPVVSGFDVLKWLRGQAGFRDLPVVVFSSSSLGQDKQGSDEMGANGYLEKPASAKEFRRIVEQVQKRWLSEKPVGRKPAPGQPAIKMTKLVQDKATKAFLAENGLWTKDLGRALVFPNLETARRAVGQQGLKGVELYYLFGEEPSSYDFTISLVP